VITAVLAPAFGMSLRDLLTVYWVQSIVIGVSFFIRMVNLKAYSTELMTSDGKIMPGPKLTPRAAAGAFLLGYAIAHVLYYFLIVFEPKAPRDPLATLGLALGCIAFAVNHSYSLFHNMRLDAAGRPNLISMQYVPYLRILPMHFMGLVLHMVGGSALAVLVFLFVKTLADVAAHTVEHRIIRAGLPMRGSWKPDPKP
jgi:hypothetical protein